MPSPLAIASQLFRVAPIADFTTAEDSEFSLAIPENSFNDVDTGDRLSYRARLQNGDELPSWLTFDNATRTFSGMPPSNYVGTLNLKVIAKDLSGVVALDTFALTIANVDDPPTINTELLDLTVDEDSADNVINLLDVFEDIDNSDYGIVKSVFSNSNESLVTASVEDNNLVLDYQDNQSGTADITVQGLSNGKTVSDTFTITVNPVDDAPIIKDPISDFNVDEDFMDVVIDLNSLFTDVDNNDRQITLDIVDNSNPSLVKSVIDNQEIILSFLNDQSGTADITIQGRSNGKTVNHTFKVTVDPVDDPPVVNNAIADITVDEDASDTIVDLSNVFTDVDNDDEIQLDAYSNSNPLLLTTAINGSNLILDYQANKHGSSNITVVGRLNGQIVLDTFTVTVNSIDDAPVVKEEIADITIDEDASNTIIDLNSIFRDVDKLIHI